MSKIEIPTPPWVWRDFGTGLGLYTTTGGARAVLVSAGDMRVRDSEGLLVPITEDHPVARLMKAAPKLLDACVEALDLLEGDTSVNGALLDHLRAAVEDASGG